MLSVQKHLRHRLQSWLLPRQGLLTAHLPVPLLHAGCSAQESQPWTSPAKLGQISTEKVVLTAGKKLLEKCFKQMHFKIFVLSAVTTGTPQDSFKRCLRLHHTFYTINY